MARESLRIQKAPRGKKHYPCVWCGRKNCVSECDLCEVVYECFLARDEDWARLPPELREGSLCAKCFSKHTGARIEKDRRGKIVRNRRVGGGHTYRGSP